MMIKNLKIKFRVIRSKFIESAAESLFNEKQLETEQIKLHDTKSFQSSQNTS